MEVKAASRLMCCKCALGLRPRRCRHAFNGAQYGGHLIAVKPPNRLASKPRAQEPEGGVAHNECTDAGT
eukprot:1155962-Pelagomonas_calceolata.AAC.13